MYPLLLECNAPGTGKGAAMKEKFIKKIIIIISIIKILILRGAPDNPAQCSHTSHRG